MRIISFLALVFTSLVAGSLVGSLSEQNPLLDTNCNCDGIISTTPNDTYHICNNATLGPQLLPWRLPLLSLVSDYDRFGSLTPSKFLQKYWIPANETQNATWRYPPQDGFQLDIDGRSIKGLMWLRKGLKVDRFGYESGRYVSAADAPFSQRALPPDALNVCQVTDVNCNPRDHPWSYHVYEVAKDFQAVGGPISAGFEQPGGGIQYFLGFRVSELLTLGYLTPLNLTAILPGPGASGKCGKKPVNCVCERPT